MAKKVRPAAHVGYHGWWYYRLDELCELLELTPTALFTQYGDLSKDENFLGIENYKGEFENAYIPELIKFESEIRQLADTDPDLAVEVWTQNTYVPAGWANVVIDEVTGVAEQERQARIDATAQRLKKEVLLKGYATIRYTNRIDDYSYEDMLAFYQAAYELEEMGKKVGKFSAEADYQPSYDEPYEFEGVIYDASRFEEKDAYYGQSLREEESLLKAMGFFVVTADRVVTDGRKFYLRELVD